MGESKVYERSPDEIDALAEREPIFAKLYKRVRDTLDLIRDYGGIDGGHHKQWVLDQAVRKLLGPCYDAWVEE